MESLHCSSAEVVSIDCCFNVSVHVDELHEPLEAIKNTLETTEDALRYLGCSSGGGTSLVLVLVDHVLNIGEDESDHLNDGDDQ